MMAAQHLHHQAPRHLLRLHREAYEGGGLEEGASVEAWLEWERAAMRYGVPVEIGLGDLAELVRESAVILPADEHRDSHSTAGDFARWGRRGGLETLRRYGRRHYALLAGVRWGRPGAAAELAAHMLRRRRG
jgi:hypothetical protein